MPKLDFSELAKPISEDEAERLYREIMNGSKKNWRKFVEDAEKHPEMLSCWDMSISFEAFARRVRAGEYD